MAAHLTPEQEAHRRRLHAKGLSDGQIAVEVGISCARIYCWRKRRGLPANFPQGRNTSPCFTSKIVTPKMKAECIALLERGIGARIIAQETSIARKTLEKWRTKILKQKPELRRPNSTKRKTPRHPGGRLYSIFKPERRKLAFELYAEGLNDNEIASRLGVHAPAVWQWRNALFLPVNKRPSSRRERQSPASLGEIISPMANPIYAKMRESVGNGLSKDLVDDAVSEMWLAMAEGRLQVAEIASSASRFRNGVIADYASRFGARSIDEEIGHGTGLRLVDLIVDDRSSDWLEEMGASVW